MRIHVALAAGTAIFLGTSAVYAADIAAPVEEPVAVSSDWTGFHVGVHAGLASGDVTYPFSIIAIPGEIEETASGVLAGVSLGADYQFAGGFVLGVVGDISWSDYEGKLSLTLGPLAVEAGSELEWLATVRGRAGFAFDSLLVYGTAGVAFGEIESGASVAGLGGISTKTDHVGWTAGAGLEYAFTDNVSLSTEYLYVDLGDENLIDFGAAATLDVETQFHTLKVGLNYRF